MSIRVRTSASRLAFAEAGCRSSATTSSFSQSTKPFREIPRVPSFPVIGSTWIYSRILRNRHPDERHKVSMELYRKYGPIFVEKLPGRYSLVHLFSGADVKNLYLQEGKEPFRVGATPFKHYRESRPQYYTDCGLLNLQGNEWQNFRSKTQPHILKVNTTKSYVPTMNRVCEEAVDLIDQLMDEQGEVKDCFTVLRRWALEGIVLASVDARLGALRNPLDPTSDAAALLNDMETIFYCMQKFGYRFPYFHYLRTPTWRRFEHAMDDFTVRTYRHIEEAARRMEREQSQSEPTILQNLLVGRNMTLGEVIAFTSDLQMAGVHTTAGAALHFLLELAKNPRAQQEARKEVSAVFGNSATIIEQRQLGNLPFLKACLKESLRLNPRVPGIYRKFDNDVVMSGYVVPAGVPMLIEAYVASRIEENFDSPQTFIPERWLKSNKNMWAHDSYASLPFSYGPRMCLGRRMAELQIYLLMIKVLLRYEIQYEKEEVDFHGQLIFVPKNPVDITFKRLPVPMEAKATVL